MRHLARARRGAVGGLMLLASAGIALAGLAIAAPSASASTTLTVVIKFGDLGDCGGGAYFCYLPSPATVSVGDTVNWTDQSGFGPHTVTRCDPQVCAGHEGGTGSDSPLDGFVGPGQDFSHTFTGPGTYVYYCRIHGYALMHGDVTVAAGGTTTTTTTTTSTTTTTAASTTTTATTPTSEPPTTATVRATSAGVTPATAGSVDPVDTTTPRAPLARTGSDLRLVYVGLTSIGAGVLLVSAELRTRRSRRVRR